MSELDNGNLGPFFDALNEMRDGLTELEALVEQGVILPGPIRRLMAGTRAALDEYDQAN
jgi:hypothetical protein